MNRQAWRMARSGEMIRMRRLIKRRQQWPEVTKQAGVENGEVRRDDPEETFASEVGQE